MVGKNQIENSKTSYEIENKNKRSIEYNIPFPETLARSIERFIEKFHTLIGIFFFYIFY